MHWKQNKDYSCLEDIEEIRDLVLQSICRQEPSSNEKTSPEQVHIYCKKKSKTIIIPLGNHNLLII